jgi:hypothetical protein
MAWLTWRQHRSQLLGGLFLIFGIALATLLSGLPVRNAYHAQALAGCLPPSARSGCDLIVRHFESEFVTGRQVARSLVLLPALLGLFVGAPLLARELEHGTHQLAWTQGLTRRRWLLSKASLLGASSLLGACALAGLAMWWRQPFDAFEGRISPRVFDIEGIVVPAYALFALAVGILAGLLLRRTVAAMTVTAIVFLGVRLGVERLLRPHYLAPLHVSAEGTAPGSYPSAWVVHDQLVDASGTPIATAREDLAILHAQQARLEPHAYISSLGWHRIVELQPGSRFWAFQAIESAVFVSLAVLLLVATVWLLRRTPR